MLFISECRGGVTYGDHCEHRCADRHCLYISTCDVNTGLCVGGCQPGWRGDVCSKRNLYMYTHTHQYAHTFRYSQSPTQTQSPTKTR